MWIHSRGRRRGDRVGPGLGRRAARSATGITDTYCTGARQQDKRTDGVGFRAGEHASPRERGGVRTTEGGLGNSTVDKTRNRRAAIPAGGHSGPPRWWSPDLTRRVPSGSPVLTGTAPPAAACRHRPALPPEGRPGAGGVGTNTLGALPRIAVEQPVDLRRRPTAEFPSNCRSPYRTGPPETHRIISCNQGSNPKDISRDDRLHSRCGLLAPGRTPRRSGAGFHSPAGSRRRRRT